MPASPEWASGIRGRLRAAVPLGPLCWLRCGGPAEWLFEPADSSDLQQLLAQLPASMPILVIGLGSNLLVRDGGVRGIVIRLTEGLAAIHHDGNILHAGAGAADARIARAAQAAGLAGLEFLAGIPGTIGGAFRTNAGAYGRSLADILVQASALDRKGQRHVLTVAECGFAYRHSTVPPDWIITDVVLRGTPEAPSVIAARMQDIQQQRLATQPIKSRTGGSTFANPAALESPFKAWQLIEQVGGRGLRQGAAQFSDLHCNFLINHGGATAAELETLGETVRTRVAAATGIMLRWEIERVGMPAAEPAA